MRIKDVIMGKYYRHKDHPDYAWAKPLKIIPPKQGVNTHGYPIIECEWTIYKDATTGLIKYFKASNLVEAPTNAKE
jgi:hypothetical protein